MNTNTTLPKDLPDTSEIDQYRIDNAEAVDSFMNPSVPKKLTISSDQAFHVLFLIVLVSAWLGGLLIKKFMSHRPLAAGWMSMLIAGAINFLFFPTFLAFMGQTVLVPLFYMCVGILSYVVFFLT